MRRSTGTFRHCTSALVASALALAACDGTTSSPASDTTGGAGSEDTAAVSPSAKLDPRLGLDRSADQPREVVAILESGIAPAAQLEEAAAGLQAARLEALAVRLDEGKDRLFARLAAHKLSATHRYRNLPAVAVRVDSAEALAALAADPAVVQVVPNQAYQMLETPTANLTLINQPAAATAGKLGAGASVAVLDTGADYTRAPFNCTAAGATGCPIAYAADMATEDNNVDDNGHGTNVSGVVLAVAPAAKVIALDVFRGASAWTTDILAAINWTITNKAKYNIVAINLSLGGGAFTATCAIDPLAVGVASAKNAGILSAIASGNDAKTNAISSPACAPAAISVGAVHAANLGSVQWSICGDATTKADQVACFSNSASFLTILAPGVMIKAAGITMSGTSQATPHVAGAIAVLRAAFPTESTAAIVARLTDKGVPVKDPRNNITKPRLDLLASLNAAAEAPPAPGPLGTIVLAGGAKLTKSATVDVALATSSGVATQVCVSEAASCTAWTPVVTSMKFALSKGDGNKTVRAWWKNAAGTISATPASASILLDSTAPINGVLSAAGTGLSVKFSWPGFSDGTGSGVDSYKLVTATDGMIPEGCGTGVVAYSGPEITFTKKFPSAGTYYVRVCATDKAGNVSAGRAAKIMFSANTK